MSFPYAQSQERHFENIVRGRLCEVTAESAPGTAIVLDGKATADALKAELAETVAKLKASGVTPGLGSILVGDDPASATYVSAKRKACEELGIASVHRHLDKAIDQSELHAVIAEMNDRVDVDAILVQLPLPSALHETEALLAVDPAKDVDGLHPVNLGKLVMAAPGSLPCTPAGIQYLLGHYNVPIEGKHVVIVGRGLTIGRPAALLFAMKRALANAAVTVVHTGVSNMADYVRRGDVVIAAAGAPGIITKDMIKPGAAVVGAGVTRYGKRLLSDVCDDVADVAGWITPRIGGVGPMTIAMLLSNTVSAAKNRSATK